MLSRSTAPHLHWQVTLGRTLSDYEIGKSALPLVPPLCGGVQIFFKTHTGKTIASGVPRAAGKAFRVLQVVEKDQFEI